MLEERRAFDLMNEAGLPTEHTVAKPTLLGVPFDDLTVDQTVERIVRWIDEEPERLHQVATGNPEFLVAARRDARFRAVLQSADLVTADGVGILLGSRIVGWPIRHRVTGVDLVESLAARGDSRLRLFLLGAGPGIAARAAAQLRHRFPAVRICGVWEGSPRPEDAPAIFDHLRRAEANVLLVAYGAPRQDAWIDTYRNRLVDCGIVVAIGIGGTLDYLAGAVPRAPGWVRRFGFEWLYRLIRQPWRWRRQLALPLFCLLVVGQRLGFTRPDTLDH